MGWSCSQFQGALATVESIGPLPLAWARGPNSSWGAEPDQWLRGAGKAGWHGGRNRAYL